MQRKWKRHWKRWAKAVVSPVAAGLLVLSVYSQAFANPTGGTVSSGSATIATSGSSMIINQTTNRVSINWDSFSVAKGESVNFVQPSSTSVALNRVIGNNVSSIYGNLNANGKVYLINPNGILFADGAQINVGGLVASTLNISDVDFMNRNITFSGSSTSHVTNLGNINATNEVVFIGPQIKNEGVIAAKVTSLAAGNKVSLDFSGDSLVNVTVDTQATGGTAINSGAITASGGIVIMSAGTADALLSTVVNNSGVIRAQSINNVGGVIRLEGSTATNSGILDASGKNSRQTGGTVKVLGDNVKLTETATIDVSGDAGGGTVLIGGAGLGRNDEYAARTTTIASGAIINADAIMTGNGGNVVVWSNGNSTFAGTITANGGSTIGNGGSVETSGHYLTVSGTVRAGSSNGANGSWLLDPYDLTVNATAANTIMSSLNSGTNVTLTTSVNGSSGVGTISSGNGDISVASNITWSGNAALVLSAYRNINVNAALVSDTGAVTLRADNSGTGIGTVSFASGSSTGSISTNGVVSLYYNPAGTISMMINGSNVTVPDYIHPTNFFSFVSPYTTGSTVSHTAYMLVNNLNELQAMRLNLTGNYALGRDIDASATQLWNYNSSNGTYSGFVPIGDATASFSGVFDGSGYTVNGLSINRPSNWYIGLFGSNYGDLRNIKLVGANVIGKSYVGSVTGSNYGKITNSYSTGVISGNGDSTGGLAGENFGSITSSYSNGMVTNSGVITGGLVGNNGNTGTIIGSYNKGSVEGSGNSAGGLAGENYGTIINSSNTGNVTGSNSVGGVAGYNASAGSILSSFNLGGVKGTNSYVGGLVGANYGAISSSYSKGTVTNDGFITGGLVGSNTISGFITNSYNTGYIKGSNNSTGGLTGENYGRISDAYNTGSVNGTDSVGGLAGYNDASGSIQNSFTTGSVTGNSWVGGLGGNNSGAIENAYNVGMVSGIGDFVGGLVGNNYGSGTIKTSYNAGKVTVIGATRFGGLAGSNTGSSITDCYWDVMTSGISIGIGNDVSGDALGLTTDQMKQLSSYAPSWDFGNNWRIYDGYSYPLLKSFLNPLTITAKNDSKTYTGNYYSGGNGITYFGFVNGDSSNNLSGTLYYLGTSQNAVNTGTYTIIPAGLYSDQFGYDINYVGGTLTILPAQIPSKGSNSSLTRSTYIEKVVSANKALPKFELMPTNPAVIEVVGGNYVSSYSVGNTVASIYVTEINEEVSKVEIIGLSKTAETEKQQNLVIYTTGINGQSISDWYNLLIGQNTIYLSKIEGQTSKVYSTSNVGDSRCNFNLTDKNGRIASFTIAYADDVLSIISINEVASNMINTDQRVITATGIITAKNRLGVVIDNLKAVFLKKNI